MKIKGMTPVRSGIAFTIIIVMFIGVSFFVSLLAWRGDSLQLSLFEDIILSEGVVLLPGLIIAALSGSEVGEIFRFRKIRISTCVLVVLFMICIEPLVSVVNAFSLLFFDNQALEITKQYMDSDSSFIYVALIMAVIGPIAEELTFRGIIYAGLRKSGRILGAIVLQAILFGLMHLNFNQMSYAIILGIAWGILNEVTNSMIPGLIGHFMINIGGVISSFALMKYLPDMADASITTEEVMDTMLFSGILSILFTTLAVLLLFRIADNEPGGKFRLARIFHGHDLKVIKSDGSEAIIKRPPVYTIPVVIGILIALSEMVITQVLSM